MDWKWLLTSFDGRINRAKFWTGVGVLVLLGIVATVIDIMVGSSIDVGGGAQMGIVSILASLASIYLALALYAKRWHDRDKSGWWSLIAIVPFIGAIWILVELGMLEGTRGANQYGPDPLA
jgi:uncharacterized membrane protein YhaH (DUF805 family)